MNKTLILCLALGSAVHGWSQTASPLARKYAKGDQYRYKLTCISYRGGNRTSTTISEAQLTVGFDSLGVPYDQVRWLTCVQFTSKDTTNLTAQAVAVKPYCFSLDPKGSLALPPLTVPAMTEAITDLHTFFVAISPALGATRLKTAGDSYTKPQPVVGDFSNGTSILKGQDCLQTSVTIKSETPDDIFVRTNFDPPATTCLSYLLPEMNTPVIADTANNFQMLMPAAPGKYHVQYGRELFFIDSKVKRTDGRLLDASMYNILSLKLKLNCDQQYQNCPMQMPLTIERRLALQLEP